MENCSPSSTGKPLGFESTGKPLGLERAPQASYACFMYCVLQLPIYVVLYPCRLLLAVYHTWFKRRLPTASDSVQFILSTSMCLLAQKSANRPGVYEIHVKNCKIKFSDDGQPFKSWRIVFTLDHKILDFQINGNAIHDPEVMFSTLVLYFVSVQHAKTHAVADAFATYIKKHNVRQLFPSLRVTDALHTMLLNSVMSPLAEKSVFVLRGAYGLPCTMSSFLQEMQNWSDFQHSGAQLLVDASPFLRFLWIARSACIDQARTLGLPWEQGEYFFITTVLHSVDHYSSYKFIKDLTFSLDFVNPKGVIANKFFLQWQYLRSAFFANMFMAPTLNPAFANLMRDMPKDSVYGHVFRKMHAEDPELANVVNASIMY